MLLRFRNARKRRTRTESGDRAQGPGRESRNQVDGEDFTITSGPRIGPHPDTRSRSRRFRLAGPGTRRGWLTPNSVADRPIWLPELPRVRTDRWPQNAPFSASPMTCGLSRHGPDPRRPSGRLVELGPTPSVVRRRGAASWPAVLSPPEPQSPATARQRSVGGLPQFRFALPADLFLWLVVEATCLIRTLAEQQAKRPPPLPRTADFGVDEGSLHISGRSTSSDPRRLAAQE